MPLVLCVLVPARVAPASRQQADADVRVLTAIRVAASPQGIGFSSDGRRAYVVSSVGQMLTVLDATTDTVEKTLPLTDLPRGIALTPDGAHAAVSHFGADRISRVELATGKIDRTIRVGVGPSLFVRTPDGRRAFVSSERANRVYEIDLLAFSVIKSFETGQRPFPPVISEEAQWLFVPGYDSGDVTVIDLLARKLHSRFKLSAHPSGGAMLPGDQECALVDRESGTLSVIDISTLRVRMLEGVAQLEPSSLVLAPGVGLGFVSNAASSSVSVLKILSEPAQLVPVAHIKVGEKPIVMALHPSGRKLYVSCEGSNEVWVLAIPERSQG